MAGGFRLFSRAGKTRVVPVGLKILLIFICLILLSSFVTNFISIQLSQRQIINLNNTIMVEQLKQLYNDSSNQFQIYAYSQNRDDSVSAIRHSAESGFANANSVALGLKPDGVVDFAACSNPGTDWSVFPDAVVLEQLNADFADGVSEGSVSFRAEDGDYFGVYKYQDDWDYYLIRAEKRTDVRENTKRLYAYTSILIVSLTVLFIIIGYIILHREFRPLRSFTGNLFQMQEKKELGLIDLSLAPNDDITYMAASFNSLSAQVNNLLGTFQKFVSKDIVAKAYAGQDVGLEGSQQELTMLFSDVKSFTYRTETLGNDIIEVLNVHYNRVIHNVHENGGIVGSIIGDAILAVYGTLESRQSKSFNAIRSAWDITRATAELREIMTAHRAEIERSRALSESEERVFQAVMVDVGVGVDGGNVFYGTIGRNDANDPRQAHMANTVIGDTVNSASRLEGLTRFYHIPVIVSEYIKNEVEKESGRYKFIELDTVQVKGKTEGKKIFFPFDTDEMPGELLQRYTVFESALHSYYAGDWKEARRLFKDCALEVTDVFLERMGNKNPPENWSGIWAMTTK